MGQLQSLDAWHLWDCTPVIRLPVICPGFRTLSDGLQGPSEYTDMQSQKSMHVCVCVYVRARVCVYG